MNQRRRSSPQCRVTRMAALAGQAYRGTTAIEYAMILPVFLALVFGCIDAGRIMWTQVTLDRAVQTAARCASINTTTCGSAAAIQAYAVSQSWGLDLDPAIFTSQSLACGNSVSASLAFRLTIPWAGSSTLMLGANACHPDQG